MMRDKLVVFAVALLAGLQVVSGGSVFPTSPDYTVRVNGNPVDVWLTPTPQMTVPKEYCHPYSYAGFDVEGDAKVEVAWKNGGTNFTARAPFKLALTPFGRNRALLMFADQPERERPAKDRKGLRYFAAGRHRVGKLTLEQGEELYLERGAVLEGAVVGKGRNRIFGRGVISGEPWPWLKGPNNNMVQLRGDHQRIEGVVLWSSYAWALNFQGCTNSVADGVKVLGGRVLNDDGIDFCRCRNVVARNCLVRSIDDCLAPKWHCDNIVATNLLCWCDAANVVRIGYECSPSPLKLANILFKDITVARMSPRSRKPTAYWANAMFEMRATNEGRIENVHFEDITLQAVDDPNSTFLIMKSMKLNDDYHCGYAPKTGGYFANITFKNVRLPYGLRSHVYYFEQDAAHAFKRPDLSGVTDIPPSPSL